VERTHLALWALACAVAVAAAWVAVPLFSVSPGHVAPGPDLAPLYLGARALWDGLEPTDPAVQRAIWQNVGSGIHPSVFFMPYPVTAALLSMPLCYLGWAELLTPLWVGSAICLVAGGLSAALWAREFKSGAAALAGACGVVAVCGLDVCRHSLELGQVNPLVVGGLLLAAAFLVRGWDVPAGILIGLGVALKFLPGVLLLPALVLWRWKVLVAAAAAFAVVVVATFGVHPDWRPGLDLARAFEQATIGQASEHPPFGGLWKLRGILAGVVVVGLSVWIGLKRRDRVACGAVVTLALAWAAVETGGMLPPHEVLLIAPALVALVASVALHDWRWGAGSVAVVALVLSPLDHYPQQDMFSQDHALVLLGLLFAGAVAQGIWVATRPVPVPAPVA
jgi:hypothetical protein